MSRRSVWSVAALATLGAIGLWYALEAGGGGEPAPTPPSGAPTPSAGAPTTPAAASGGVASGERDEPALARDSAPPQPPAAQGLRGRVVDEAQRPLPGCAVYLVESVGNDPLAIPMLQQQGGAFGPVARTATDPEGGFAVGLPVAQDKTYELYVQAAGFATARRGGLRLCAGSWHDLGAIPLVRGAVLRGRVAVAGRPDIPVPGATVVVEVGGAFADAALRALPEAGVGLVATTNGHGEYELPYVPARGVVQASAVGPGFARQLRSNVEIAAEGPTLVDFALAPGHVLAGTVVDSNGRPLEGAVVEAWPQQSAASALAATTGDDGRFEVIGLAAGAHRLRVRAAGWQPQDVRGIEAGSTDLRVVLHRQAGMRVRVVTPNGTTVRSYQLAVRRWFAETPDRLAAAIEVPEQRVRLDGATDFAVVPAVPAGWFRVQIDAEGFARTFSEPIDHTGAVDAGTAGSRDVVVTLTPGASLRGRVVDEHGLPVVGAVVHTDPDGHAPDSAFVRLLAGALPDATTAAHATTGADGTFHLPRLAFGAYQVRVDHDAACRAIATGIRLDRVEDRVLPPIRLVAGAEVRGRVAGATGGQVKVVLTTLPEVVDPALALRLECVAAPDGTFRMPRHVPPGTYELAAASLGTAEPEAQIFAQLAQLRRTAIRVVVPPGQRVVERDVLLTTAN